MAESEIREEDKVTVLYSRCDDSSACGNSDRNLIQNVFYFEPEDDETRVYAPKWPFMKWGNDKSERKSVPLDHKPDKNQTHLTSCFSTLVDKLAKNINTFEDDTSKSIFSDIQRTMNVTVCELSSLYPIFKECVLKLAGSVCEGTKIGTANEFDYLLILELFKDRNTFRLFVRENFMMVEVINLESAEAFIIEDMIVEKDGRVFLKKIRQILMTLFVKEFEKNLPTGWLLKRTDGSICMSHIATTLHLQCTKYYIEVDVDVCICCPILPVDVEATLRTQDEKLRDSEREFFKYLKNRNEKIPLEIFAIIAGDEHAFSGLMYTRVATPSLEMELISKIGKEDGRIRTYCVSKCIAQYFLPKVTSVFGCKRCCHNLVRSYHLKNILFFMIKRYPDDSDWSHELVSHRVLDVYNMLHLCVNTTTDSDKEMKKSVSTFCTPGSLWLEDMSTFNPYIPEENRVSERSDFLFTEDSHKPLYQISSSPVTKDALKMDNTDFNTELEHWFTNLNKEHWTSYELLEKLYLFLEKLGKLPQTKETINSGVNKSNSLAI